MVQGLCRCQGRVALTKSELSHCKSLGVPFSENLPSVFSFGLYNFATSGSHSKVLQYFWYSPLKYWDARQTCSPNNLAMKCHLGEAVLLWQEDVLASKFHLQVGCKYCWHSHSSTKEKGKWGLTVWIGACLTKSILRSVAIKLFLESEILFWLLLLFNFRISVSLHVVLPDCQSSLQEYSCEWERDAGIFHLYGEEQQEQAGPEIRR